MLRVASALKKHAPEGVEAVSKIEDADLRIVHVIGHGSMDGVNPEQPHVIIQYCLRSTEDGGKLEYWLPIWRKARMVWSYYRLDQLGAFPFVNFYHSPLGVDEVFRKEFNGAYRDIGVMTSGFVAESESVEEVAAAAAEARLRVVHIGPSNVLRRKAPKNWNAMEGVTDQELAMLYRRSLWVSGLRHAEGFELPAVEGLVSGARPIVFDRDDMRQWYSNHAVFVRECSGHRLIGSLLDIFRHQPTVVTRDEQAAALQFFDWARIAPAFWKRLGSVNA
jgi:hypothetical protein